MLADCNPNSKHTHFVGLMLGIQCWCNVLVQRGPPLAQHVGAMLLTYVIVGPTLDQYEIICCFRFRKFETILASPMLNRMQTNL